MWDYNKKFEHYKKLNNFNNNIQINTNNNICNIYWTYEFGSMIRAFNSLLCLGL